MSYRPNTRRRATKNAALHLLLLLLLAFVTRNDLFCVADQAVDGDDDVEEQNDDGAAAADGADEGQEEEEEQNNGDDLYNFYDGDDQIQYWTDYAIYTQRCINYNNVDVIVYDIYDQESNHCSDTPVGSYISPVPYFVNGYLKQYAQRMQDQGNDDYQAPEAAAYVQCTPFEIQGQYFYFQLGCADYETNKLAVNIYSNKDCTARSIVNGFDDSNIDVSAIKLPFQKCQACVNWVNMDDANIDDMFYENRMKNAPLCKTAWTYKETCNRKCQHTGLSQSSAALGWNRADKVILSVLFLFACLMIGLIFNKRRKMSNKDALLEQAAMSAAGLQQSHLAGISVLAVIVVAVFALLGLKNITWALLLIINSSLFAYLMKLTLDSGVGAGDTVIGPDGTILKKDSDDSSTESSHESSRRNQGSYMLPTIA